MQANSYGYTTGHGSVITLCSIAFDEEARRDRGEYPFTLPAYRNQMARTILHELMHVCGTVDYPPEAEAITQQAFGRYWSGKCGN